MLFGHMLSPDIQQHHALLLRSAGSQETKKPGTFLNPHLFIFRLVKRIKLSPYFREVTNIPVAALGDVYCIQIFFFPLTETKFTEYVVSIWKAVICFCALDIKNDLETFTFKQIHHPSPPFARCFHLAVKWGTSSCTFELRHFWLFINDIFPPVHFNNLLLTFLTYRYDDTSLENYRYMVIIEEICVKCFWFINLFWTLLKIQLKKKLKLVPKLGRRTCLVITIVNQQRGPQTVEAPKSKRCFSFLLLVIFVHLAFVSCEELFIHTYFLKAITAYLMWNSSI